MEVWARAQELTAQQRSFVMVTLVSIRGGAPQDVGAKALITEEGLHWGTVGGGKVEARAIQFSRQLLDERARDPQLLTWNLQRDIGMTCGGECIYLFEPQIIDPWQIVIYGAGHCSQALVRVLEPMRCRLTCIDPREEWVAKLPTGAKLIARHVPEMAATVPEFDERTYFVVMTQGHATDVPVLEAISRHFPNAPFVGNVGSKVKAIKIRSELRSRGVPEDFLEKLRCPIGLPIGGNDPSEIAISTAAQLLQVRDQLEGSA